MTGDREKKTADNCGDQKPGALYQISSKFLLFFVAFGMTVFLWFINLTLRIFVTPTGGNIIICDKYLLKFLTQLAWSTLHMHFVYMVLAVYSEKCFLNVIQLS